MTTDKLNQKPLYPAIDRRSREPEYFDGMKHFKHPRLGAKPNRRLPGVDKWQEQKAAPSEILGTEQLIGDVEEYLHWRKVNPQIKGGENYLKRFRESLASSKREMVNRDDLVQKLKNILFNIDRGLADKSALAGAQLKLQDLITQIEGGSS